MAKPTFERFRTRAAVVALVVTFGSVVLLFVIAQFSPDTQGVRQKGRMTPLQASTSQNVVAVLLSIGVVSFAYEVFLREAHSRELWDYMKLKAAIVTSGLDELGPESAVDWRDSLRDASQVTALIIDPNRWLMEALPDLLAAARQRVVKMTIGLPDYDDKKKFTEVASATGLTADELKQAIELAVRAVGVQWAAVQSQLQKGSSIRLVSYSGSPSYELFVTESRVVLLMGSILRHSPGDPRLALGFTQDAAEYPSSWLRPQLDELAQANELWAGKA